MKKDNNFGNLFRKIHYSGSHFDRLKVGNRQEYDLNILFYTPEKLRISGGSVKQPHFMGFNSWDDSEDFDCIINDNYSIDPQKMFMVMQKAADRAMSRMNNSTRVGNVPVRITRTISKPYTFMLNPTQGRYQDTIEIDMVPAFEIPIDLLPRKTKMWVRLVEERMRVREDYCLALALPTDNTKQLRVDFPQLARKMMANKPSLKAAIRMFKYERDLMGGPFMKIKSYTIKNAGLWEAFKIPSNKWWKLSNMEDWFFRIRNSLANGLLCDEFADLFFPTLNLMKRVKSEVKEGTGKYLRKTNQGFEELFICRENSCWEVFFSERSMAKHYNVKHVKNVYYY